MPKSLPSPELLRKLLSYDPQTGVLTWRERELDMFEDGKYSAERACAAWNSRCAGKEAFTAYNAGGYKHGKIFGQTYRAHRVIWVIYHGCWPKHQIDHINGDQSDNRIKNLRDVTPKENKKNTKIPSNNTSGVVGVYWNKLTNKWRAQITIDGRDIYLGRFETKDEAVAVRKAAEKRYEFHENHGRD